MPLLIMLVTVNMKSEFTGSVNHTHTSMEIQYTDIFLEVLRDPKLDIRVHNSTNNDIKTVFFHKFKRRQNGIFSQNKMTYKSNFFRI